MYYDEHEYFEAVKAYEEAEIAADKVIGQVITFTRGQLPERQITDDDIAIIKRRDQAWERVLELARRPSRS